MNIIITPIITEKTTMLAGDGWYTFRTKKDTGKKEAKTLIENNFKVNVVAIRSITGQRKLRRRGKEVGYTKGYKKILVKLKKGQRIDIFEIST